MSNLHSNRLMSVDALRGLAATAVVITHLPRSLDGKIDWNWLMVLPLQLGSLGVPLFLLLSGFCIHLSTAKRLASARSIDHRWKAFWTKRFWRLYPPYLAAIAFSLAVWLAVRPMELQPQLESSQGLGLDLASHLLLLHNLTQEFSLGLANEPFWTLGLEEQLYALFFVVLLLRRRMSAVSILWIGLAVTLAWRWAVVWLSWYLATHGVPREEQTLNFGSFALGRWSHWPFSYWFLWILGAVAAEAHCGLVKLPRWCYSLTPAMILVFLCVIVHPQTMGRYATYWLNDDGFIGIVRAAMQSAVALAEPLFAVACFILLNRWVEKEQRGESMGQWIACWSGIGLFSYSLYLTHQPLLRLLHYLFFDAEKLEPLWFRAPICVPICMAFAWVFYRVIEVHFLNRAAASVAWKAPASSPVY